MAEQQEIVDTVSTEVNPDSKSEMEVEVAAPKADTSDKTTEKREREQTEEAEEGGESKKHKVVEEEKSNDSCPVKLGLKEFVTSVAMFDYLTKFMHFWRTDLDVNKVQMGTHSFTFGHVYGSNGSPSSSMFGQCVAPLVDGLFHGYNATVLASDVVICVSDG